jgi:predicted ATPase
VKFRVFDQTIKPLFFENGLKTPLTAQRLSDGTLHFLALIYVACSFPEPPPVICIEEPETGLHPDIIHVIARLLVEASHRTQLFVTTHSEHLIDALSDVPEAVIVTEKME